MSAKKTFTTAAENLASRIGKLSMQRRSLQSQLNIVDSQLEDALRRADAVSTSFELLPEEKEDAS